jgi:hypothetical protein
MSLAGGLITNNDAVAGVNGQAFDIVTCIAPDGDPPRIRADVFGDEHAQPRGRQRCCGAFVQQAGAGRSLRRPHSTHIMSVSVVSVKHSTRLAHAPIDVSCKDGVM